MSYKYMVLDDMKAPAEERDRVFTEREKMKADCGHDDNFGYIIDFSHALLHNETERARQVVECLPESQMATKMLYYSKLFYAKQEYKLAYEYQVKYKSLLDSINNDNARKTSLDAGMMIDKVLAESQTKDLRIANQKLEMERIANELQQKSIQEQTLAMNMAMQQSRLNEIEAQHESDSLIANYKEL